MVSRRCALAPRRRKRGQRRSGHAVSTKPAPKRATSAPKDLPPGARQARQGSRGGWPMQAPMTRSQRRDAEVRAGLTPMRTGERPGAIIAGAVIAALLGVGNLIAFAAGVKIGGKHPAAGGIVIFSVVMIACSI